MPFELWSKDEYGQGSIIARFTDWSKLVARARQEVNDINVDNALTAGEKQHSWEAYFLDMIEDDRPTMNRIYAGNNPDGKHRVNVISKNGSSLEKMTDADQVRIYLGELDGETWYATDNKGKGKDKGKVIDSIFSREGKAAIEGKTVFFARVI